MLGLNMGCVQCLENPPGEKKNKKKLATVLLMKKQILNWFLPKRK